MNDVTLTPVVPTPDEMQYLEDRIYEFNSSATGIGDGEALALFMREGDRIVAGVCGNTWGGTCEVRQFWVEESHRGRGLGTRLFQAIEREARRRGCTQIVRFRSKRQHSTRGAVSRSSRRSTIIHRDTRTS